MGVFADRVVGTIGGGHLEHQAMAQARRLLLDPLLPASPQRWALGSSLGQCCGGVVMLDFERLHAPDSARLKERLQAPLAPVALFGGGHVGHALARLLLTLPYALTWIDSRDGVFPTGLPARVHCEHAEPVQDAVPDLAPGSEVLVMSFSHAEDLDIVAACLKRQRAQGDLAFVGLIGSQTKWASFSHRLQEMGFSPEELAQVSCPIGLPGLVGKEPEVIAVAVAAQLLMRRTLI
jgi:xanthine dehydrogenase accessory factor